VGLLSLTLAACAPPPAPLPATPLAAGDKLILKTTAVPLNADDPAQDRVGDFVYAGGVTLSSDQTSRLHGLSDLVVKGDRLWSVSDEGDAFEARLVLDEAGRLVDVTDGKLSPLVGLDGQPLQGKAWGDSEGLAILPNGDRLVSFEREHRIWRYPAAGGPPLAVPKPEVAMAENDGMEAIVADPRLAPDAYEVGVENTGQVWSCRLAASCAPLSVVEKADDFGLASMTRGPGGLRVHLLRAWDPLRGNRIIVRVQAPGAAPADLTLSRPLTVDNFEGVAAVPGPHGGVRLYLLSDDNFQSSQRTLLLAFDWTPAR
jgi:hypothetical protein